MYLKPLALILQIRHRYPFGTNPYLIYICDLAPVIKVKALYVGYPLIEQMEFLEMCIDMSYRQAKAYRL